jgi:hypothetical protein
MRRAVGDVLEETHHSAMTKNTNAKGIHDPCSTGFFCSDIFTARASCVDLKMTTKSNSTNEKILQRFMLNACVSTINRKREIRCENFKSRFVLLV